MIYQILIYSGTLPFFGGLIFHLLGYPIAISLVKAYSFMIFSFMSGTYWGFAFKENILDRKLLLMSNIFAILIWGIYFTENYFIFAAILFLIILLCDYYLLQKILVDINYFKTRILVTIILLPVILYFGYYEISLV